MVKRVGFLIGLVGLAVVVGLFSDANRPSDETEIARMSDPANIEFDEALEVDLGASELTPTGLYVQRLEEGEGPASRPGDSLWVHYAGWLPTGSLFDSSRDRQPLAMQLGVTGLIDGWTEGVTDMRHGERRRLVIRPELGYGAGGRGRIPPYSVLVFEVELVRLVKAEDNSGGP